MTRDSASTRLISCGMLLGALGATALLPTAVRAELLLYDPFSYDGSPTSYLLGDDSTGTNLLGGQNPAGQPTAFYAGPWQQSGGDAQAVRAGSLQYPMFPWAGGRVTDSVEFECCSFGRDGRQIAGGLGGGIDARTIYQSFLVDFGNQGTDDPTQFGKRAVEWWNGGIGDAYLAVDLFVNHFSGTNEFTLQVTTPSGTDSVLLNGGGLNLANMSGTHLVVMKFEFNPATIGPAPIAADDDVVSVILDPTNSIESDWIPAAVVRVDASDLMITHQGAIANFTFSGGGHVPGTIDELRWGDTFADVTPFVPEPSSLVLFGLAMSGLLLRRRSSHK